MSFDAFTVGAVAAELSERIVDARVEKVLLPSKDEIFLVLHKGSEHFRLQINAGAQAARIGLTAEAPENPKVPPMFCMLMRKHLTGARISSVRQLGFERAIEIELQTYDEMGFFTSRKLIAEIMGRYSNAMLCDAENKILGVLRPVDFTTSSKRQVLASMTYELPPEQNKKNPLLETKEGFLESFGGKQVVTDKDISATYTGFSPLRARELASAGENDVLALWGAFETLISDVKSGRYTPVLILDGDGLPKDFSCFEVKNLPCGYKSVKKASFGELTDAFFAENERRQREKSRAHSTERLLKNAQNRIEKKLSIQRNELKDTEKKSEYKQRADIITANLYRFKGGERRITVTDYIIDNNGGYTERDVEIELENGLSAPATAQKLYKKYAKAKNAEIRIKEQMEKGEAELRYVLSVLDALDRVSGQAELDEIRAELIEMGYIKAQQSKKEQFKHKSLQKKQLGQPIKLCTSGGFTVFVGKNNLQNDHLTFKVAKKGDYWFHVKDIPGSHTLLICDGREPGEADLTEAAIFAARNSKAAGQDKVLVDYTRAKNVKKPSGARPGYVIYDSYNTTVVDGRK